MHLSRRQLRALIRETFFPLEGIGIKRVFHSPDVFTGFRETQQKALDLSRVYEKPSGLWYSCGSDWEEFIDQAGWTNKYDYLYEVELNHYDMLFIKSAHDFEKFESMYGVQGSGGAERSIVIDWPAVAKHYAGIEICPYQYEKRMSADWYYPWDVASGCVWSSKGIADIKEIQNI